MGCNRHLASQCWYIVSCYCIPVACVSPGKIKLKVTAGHRLLITPGSKSQPEYEYCAIKVVNTGDRLANITHVGWETGWFKNKKHIIQIFGTPGFDDVPKVLHEGQEANFMVPLRLNGIDEDWIVRFPKTLVGDEGKIGHIKRLKVVVGTSVGQMFRTRVEGNLVEKLLESYKANKAN